MQWFNLSGNYGSDVGPVVGWNRLVTIIPGSMWQHGGSMLRPSWEHCHCHRSGQMLSWSSRTRQPTGFNTHSIRAVIDPLYRSRHNGREWRYEFKCAVMDYYRRSPIIVTIWKVVFANKSRTPDTWMDLDETWQVGLRPEKTNPYSLHVSSEIALWVSDRARKNGSQRRCFLWGKRRTTSATFLRSISAKLSTNTCPCGGSRHMVSYSRKVQVRDRISPKKPSFLVYFRVPCLCPAYGSRETFCDA